MGSDEMSWTYKQPVKIIFGVDKVKELSSLLEDEGLKNGLLVSDPFFVESGLADEVLQYANGKLLGVFSNITPNPTVANVDECVQTIKDNEYDFVLALGGGSAIDCAKVACSVCKTPLPTAEFHSRRQKLGREHIPLVAVPTTAGTGSEVTGVSVLTDQSKGRKAPMASDNFYPRFALIDPRLTVSVTSCVTASCGLDVLSHALEGFWSKHHQPICDALALSATRTIFNYLPKAFKDGGDIKAREKVCEASVIAGLAFGLPKTAGSHACSFPLTNIFHIPHGEACALTLDSFTRINADAEGGRLHGFAKQVGFRDANDMADAILRLKIDMKMAVRLSSAGVKHEDIYELAKKSMHPNMMNNPVDIKLDDIIEMYSHIF